MSADPSEPPAHGIDRVLQRFPNGQPYFMLVSDLDHTMVQNEDPSHARQLRFNAAWQRALAPRAALVWSTGRSPALFRALWAEAPLLAPDVLVCSVGSEVFYRDPRSGEYVEDGEFARSLDAGGRWRRGEAEAAARGVAALRPQRASEQRPHKLSFHSPPGEAGRRAVAELRAALDARGMTEEVAKVVYSGGTDVDVLAAGAGKGRALEAVRAALLAALARRGQEAGAAAAAAPTAATTAPPPLPLGMQVNGDSGNDAELFDVEGARGCIVSNAHEELLEYYRARVGKEEEEQREKGAAGATAAAASATSAATTKKTLHLASEPCSGGILEALRLFGTMEAVASLEDAELGRKRAEELRAARALVVEGLLLPGASPADAPADGGATAVGAGGGRVVPFAEWAKEEEEERRRAAGEGRSLEWIDQLRTVHVADGAVLATFVRWRGTQEAAGAGEAAGGAAAAAAGGCARSGGASLTTALLRRRPGKDDGAGPCVMEVVHLHESPIAENETTTAQLDELVAGEGLGAA